MFRVSNTVVDGLARDLVTKPLSAKDLQPAMVRDNINLHNASAIIDDNALLQAQTATLFVDVSTSNNVLLGPDTTQNASRLLDVLGLKQNGQVTTLRFVPVNAAVSSPVGLGNSSGTDNHVHVRLRNSGGATGIEPLYTIHPVPVTSPYALVLVTANNTATGSHKITFDIVAQGGNTN